MIDLIVAGGGPIGLATALYADAAGLEVVVFEPRSGPIDKACGEGLMPSAVTRLKELGVEPAGRPFAGIRYTDGIKSAETRFKGPQGLGVRRTVLHQALLDRLQAKGIPLIHDSVSGIVQTGTGVAAGIDARYLAAADGLHSPMRRQLGLDMPSGRHRWGLRQHFTAQPWTDLVEVHWAPHAEAYVTPISEDTVGVAILSSRRAPYAGHLAEFPILQAKLGAPASQIRGAGPLWQRSRQRVQGRVLLVGDASGYVDALTGEGIAVGLACARELVRCIAQDRPQDYEVAWRKASRRYRLLTRSLLGAAESPRLRRLVVPASAAAPRVFAGVVRQLAR